jgi:hypothetical protein
MLVYEERLYLRCPGGRHHICWAGCVTTGKGNKTLGFKEDQCDHSFQLRDEVEVGDFLEIRIEKQKGNSFLLTRIGLIEKVITAGGMEHCNKVETPAETSPVGADIDG